VTKNLLSVVYNIGPKCQFPKIYIFEIFGLNQTPRGDNQMASKGNSKFLAINKISKMVDHTNLGIL
jgi:hypothetical protein